VAVLAVPDLGLAGFLVEASLAGLLLAVAALAADDFEPAALAVAAVFVAAVAALPLAAVLLLS